MTKKKERQGSGTKDTGRGKKRWLSPKLTEHGNVEKITRTMLRGGAPVSAG